MSHYLCLACLAVSHESEVIEHKEPDVNWSEIRCPYCQNPGISELGAQVDMLAKSLEKRFTDPREKKMFDVIWNVARGEYA